MTKNLPLPGPKELTEARAEQKRQQEIQRARPDWKTLKSELGSSLKVRETADGKIRGRVTGKAALRRLHQMTGEARRLETEHGYERRGDIPLVTMRDANGAVEHIPEAAAVKAEKQRGLRAVEKRAPQWTNIDGMWFKVTKMGLIPGEPPSRMVYE